MRSLPKVLLTAVVVASAVIASAAVPTGSFIRKPVKSVAELIQHTRTDAVVMDRFVRHFRLMPDQVLSYFGTLHVAKLARAGSYMVYNVHEDGVLRARVFQLPKGTLVFADANHRAILKLACANPMVFGVPPVGSNPGVTTEANFRDVELGTEAVDAVMINEPTVENVEVPIAPIAPVLPQANTGVIRRSDNYGGLAVLALLGAGAILIRDNDDTPPVPEPASIAALVIGAGALVSRRRKK